MAICPTLARSHRRGALLAALLLLACGPPAAAASPDALRATALELVNADRRDHGLTPLEPEPALDEAAQRHAEDMLARGYFSHASPEGERVTDRYRAAGGDDAGALGENIGSCEDCGEPDARSLRQFEQGWMQSPEHRRNILNPGFTRFGFGIAADTRDGGRQYAVQTFAGPGRPLRGADREGADAPTVLAPQERAALALEMVNEARTEAGAPELAAGTALSEAARDFLDRAAAGDAGLERINTETLLTSLGPAWGDAAVAVGQCEGCGAEPTDADVRAFVQDWLDTPDLRRRLLDRRFDAFGFALQADGEGRKQALALLAQRR